MRFLAITKPTPQFNMETVQRLLPAEMQKAKELYEQGFILEGYVDVGFTTVYLIVDAPTFEEVQQMLATYPQVQAGQITFDVVQVVGLPAAAQVASERKQPLPAWWPS